MSSAMRAGAANPGGKAGAGAGAPMPIFVLKMSSKASWIPDWSAWGVNISTKFSTTSLTQPPDTGSLHRAP
eukprot:8660356-Heterocapsa_arctica.AAC.1